MNTTDSKRKDFPHFPPGFWRRIELVPERDSITARLEDDAHRFYLQLCHDGARIAAVTARAERFPWSPCPDAGAFLADQLTGRGLMETAMLDPALHCTHLHDLAVLAAAHASDAAPSRFDMQVADRVDARTTATLLENDCIRLQWQLDGTCIQSTGEFAGRDLKELSAWRWGLSPQVARHAAMLRRAIMVSGVRRQPADGGQRPAPVQAYPSRIGACFTYQLPRARTASRSIDWTRDFSLSHEGPLADAGSDRADGRNGTP